MIGDRERHFCDTGGMGMLYELDPAQYWAGQNGEGLRNIANDPEYIERANKAMYEACMEMRERRHRHAIYSIQQQPFYT
jgi:hypothetical protein